jgi:hypothetical protein
MFSRFGRCVKQQPQLPANKGNSADSATLALRQANEKLIEAEDSLLAEYVMQQTEKYEKSDNGYWYGLSKLIRNRKQKNRR